MRQQGSITSWNDRLGIGFARPLDGGPEIAIRFDDFVDRSRAPTPGMIVTFDPATDDQGRPMARRISLPQVGMSAKAHAPKPAKPTKARSKTPWLRVALSATAAILLTVWWQMNLAPQSDARSAQDPTGITEANDAVFAQAQPFQCDGRRQCSQMSSCAEAQYFFKHCAARQMDSNGDGVACDEELSCYQP